MPGGCRNCPRLVGVAGEQRLVTYPDSVRFLYSLGNEVKTVKLGLERIQAIVDRLGNPERRVRVVHVAGTNGKGSTCAMIEAALRRAGFRTGLYISPHLVEPTERIQINGVPITTTQFAQAFEQVHQLALEMVEEGAIDAHPTYFETVTAMGFLVFAEQAVDWAVVEVGLGGRLDATNVVVPQLTVITPVDFDHEQWLGNSLWAIAGEKAGILKPGVTGVIAPQHPEAMARIRQVAEAVGAPLIAVDLDDAQAIQIDERGCQFHWNGQPVRCPLAGEHQLVNALTAVVALAQLGVAPGGIDTAKWPGRLEPFGDRPRIILDGAHNPAGVRALARHIQTFYRTRKVWLVYGSMRDKSVEEVAEILSGVAAEVILTQVALPRALRAEVLAPLFDGPRVRTAPDVAAALELVNQEAAPDDVVFVTGSLFLVGEARKLLQG